MRKSKFLIMILALVMVLAIAVACGNDDTPAATPTPTPAATPEPEVDDPGVDTEVAVETEVEEVPAITPILRPAGLVYSLETDAWVQQADVGAVGASAVLSYPGNAYLTQAGSPTWNAVEGGANDTIAVRLTNRSENWYALDIQASDFDWDVANNEYLLTVRGNLQWGGTALIQGADSPWATLAEYETDDDGDFVLSLVVNSEIMADAGSRGWLRVAANNTNNLTIYSITVTRYIPRAEGVVYSLSTDPFVQALADGVVGGGIVLATPNLSSAGSPTYGIVEGPYGNAIRLTNRGENWYALDIITGTLDWNPEANNYLLTVTGHLQWGGNAIIGGADSPWASLSEVEADDEGYFTVSLPINADTLEEAGSRQWFRIQSNNTNQLTVNEITIARQ